MSDITILNPPLPPAQSALMRHTPLMLAAIVALGFIGMLLVMCFFEVPDKNATLINTMTASLGAGFMLVLGYFFGSSSSSQAKDQTISKLSQ